MNIIKSRTKIEIVIVMLFVVIMLVASAASLTRMISDSHDDVDTFIRNSNGNYWEATYANIKQAIWDLNGTGGTVWIPNVDIPVNGIIDVTQDDITIFLYGKLYIPDGYINSNFWFDWTFGIDPDRGSIIRLMGDYCKLIGYNGAVIGNKDLAIPADQNDIIHCVSVGGSYCTVSGLQIENSNWGGIYLRYGDYNIIEDNVILNSNDYGIYLSLENNGNIVRNNIIQKTREERTEGGITVKYKSHNNIIDGNLIDFNYPDIMNNEGSGIEVLDHSGNNTVINNIIINHNSFQNPAIHIENNDGYSTRLVNNYIDNWNYHGLYIMDSCDIIGGEVSHIGKNGVEVSADNVYINGLSIHHCNNYGMLLKGGNNYFVTNCKIYDNSQSQPGIYRGLQIGWSGHTLDKVAVTENTFFDDQDTPTQQEHFIFHPSAIVTNTIVKDNIGQDYSSYELIPTSNITPYSNPADGSMYFNTGNQTLAVYYDGAWYYYNHN